ncbi:hypothetical protein HYS90_02175 [Candidatus Curtissbacteria bacterium]|nr:hypothetical protein [Candidatus Curtissbacteria bacterium]
MERLGAASKHPENQDPTKQFAIEQAKRFLRAAKVKDPGPKLDRLPSATKPEIGDPLQQSVEAYQNQPHTSELVTQTHLAIWQARGELVGATYEVTPCPYTQEELADLEANGKRVGYLPAELATQQTRHKLGEMFPKMQSNSVKEGNSVTNDENPSGWFDYESAIDAPHLDTKEGQLMDRIKKDGRTILSLNQYIVAGQDSKLFTGQYLDETRTWVRLGSRGGGRVVDAVFSGGGDLNVSSGLGADFHNPGLWVGVPRE